MTRTLLATLALLIGATLPAAAGVLGPGPGLTGNSTGGIITWSPEHQRLARRWAADHCARYGKIARITTVYPRYGQYIGFACWFPRSRY